MASEDEVEQMIFGVSDYSPNDLQDETGGSLLFKGYKTLMLERNTFMVLLYHSWVKLNLYFETFKVNLQLKERIPESDGKLFLKK